MEYAKEKAIEYSSNRAYSTADGRRKRRYPYAKRHVNAATGARNPGAPGLPLPAFKINIQSGDFVKSWAVNTQETPQGFTSSLWNYSEHAKYMRGTNRMIARPILQRVGQDVRAYRLKVEPATIRKVMKDG
jgi:hypothetical protein